ncbi:MAG: hypothetical protein MJ007_06970, partial [Paludibacteraceae bacterium]|nr:hypothetical protein [Paludibacteraceae bacterium]
CGQLYEYALTDMCLIGSGNYQIQAVAENASGKANSDIVSYNNFVCCPGIISSFKIEPTAKYVMPGELVEFKTTIQGGGANPTYVWKEKVGSGEETALVSTASNLSYVVPQGLEGGTQVTVSVTVTGSNCPDDVRTEQAVLTVCNTPVISSLAVVGTPAAWTATTITASVSNADKAEWTSMPNAELTGKSLSGATFRGGVTSTGDPYKVTIKAIENSCGNSVEQTIDVTINPDTEQCN